MLECRGLRLGNDRPKPPRSRLAVPQALAGPLYPQHQGASIQVTVQVFGTFALASLRVSTPTPKVSPTTR